MGNQIAATIPTTPRTARTIIANPYERSGVAAMPATRTVPAIAVPSDEPRLEILPDSPGISPWRSSVRITETNSPTACHHLAARC